jgi:hypothetical protein
MGGRYGSYSSRSDRRGVWCGSGTHQAVDGDGGVEGEVEGAVGEDGRLLQPQGPLVGAREVRLVPTPGLLREGSQGVRSAMMWGVGRTGACVGSRTGDR